MQQKLQELTDKIYQEGVRKGEDQSRKIVEQAENTAKKLVADAQAEAEKIASSAVAKAEELKRNAESEVRLAGQQAIHALKQQIENVITAKVLDTPLASVLSDPEVIKDLLNVIVGGWQSSSSNAGLEAILPQGKQDSLEKALKGGLHKVLGKGVTVSYSRALKTGFQIKEKDSGYKISLTDEDFAAFFGEFLRPRTKAYLFGE